MPADAGNVTDIDDESVRRALSRHAQSGDQAGRFWSTGECVRQSPNELPGRRLRWGAYISILFQIVELPLRIQCRLRIASRLPAPCEPSAMSADLAATQHL